MFMITGPLGYLLDIYAAISILLVLISSQSKFYTSPDTVTQHHDSAVWRHAGLAFGRAPPVKRLKFTGVRRRQSA